MAKKNKTLPKNFKDIVKDNDLNALKAVFDKCDINAYERYGSNTALFFHNVSTDFVHWLVEQGANIHYQNTFGNTPLSQQFRYKSNRKWADLTNELLNTNIEYDNDNSDVIELLIHLGSNLEPKTGYSPLEEACRSLNVDAVKILLEHGANPLGRIDKYSRYPLEKALYQFAPIPETLEISELLLRLDTPITETMQEYITVMGKRFEENKLDPNKDAYQEYRIRESQPIMQKLYCLFGVNPVKQRVIHDGVSQIIFEDSSHSEKEFSRLWDYLVPVSGSAKTMQGEVIRITGKIADELYRNGGRNWNQEYQKMLDSLMVYFQSAKALSSAQLADAQLSKKHIYHGNYKFFDESLKLKNLAILWVTDNPNPIKLSLPNYKL